MTVPILAKDLSLHQLFVLGFGTIIGVAWLVTAGTWIQTAGPAGAIVAFAVGGAAICVVGLCYGELGSLYPQSGGEIVYAYEAFGSAASFAMGWVLALVYVAVCGFEAIVTAWIITLLVPALETDSVAYRVFDSNVTWTALTIALAGQAAFTWVNYRGALLSAQIQEFATWAGVVITLLFVIAALIYGSIDNAKPLFEHDATGSMIPGILAVLATVPAFYAGFNALPQAVGEVADVSSLRGFARLLVITIVAAALYYAAIILATSFAASRNELAGAELPVAAALYGLFDSRLPGHAVLIAGLLGILTTWNAMFFSGARLLFALGRAHILPSAFGRVHPRYGTPSSAILFIGATGAVGIFLGRNSLMPIINLIGIVFSFAYLVTSVSLLRLRSCRPDAVRPYLMPGYPWLPWLAVMLSLTFLGLATYGVYLGSHSPWTLEYTVLLLWCALGMVLWRAAATRRAALPEGARRELILSR